MNKQIRQLISQSNRAFLENQKDKAIDLLNKSIEIATLNGLPTFSLRWRLVRLEGKNRASEVPLLREEVVYYSKKGDLFGVFLAYSQMVMILNEIGEKQKANAYLAHLEKALPALIIEYENLNRAGGNPSAENLESVRRFRCAFPLLPNPIFYLSGKFRVNGDSILYAVSHIRSTISSLSQ